MKTCRACGCEWTEKFTPGMRDECDTCGAPWHACVNCRFFADGGSDWCREPAARDEMPSDPAVANRCTFFTLHDTAKDVAADASSSRRAELDALFSSPANAADESSPKELPAWCQRPEKNKEKKKVQDKNS